MDYKLNVSDITKPQELAKLTAAISEISDQLDVLYTETAPNGNISARVGRIAIYKNGSNYETWQNTTGSTVWQRIDQGAVVVTDEKVKASSDDSTADYLDGKIKNSLVIDSEKAQLSGDSASPGNSKYYGTDSSGVKGWNDFMKGGFTNIQVFTSTGTWTKPAGVSQVYVKVWGAGGGGSTQVAGGDGGGGGGGYSEGLVTVTGDVTVTVGNGGAAGTPTGATGGASSFAGSTTPTGNGGVGGQASGVGGAGGTAANGTINLSGQDGGTVGSTLQGGGGNSPMGGAGGHGGHTVGAAGQVPGGGGSGEAAGAAGLVIVYY